MSEWWNGALADASVLNAWEAIAVVLALAYLLLAMRRSLWCWPAAAISTLIYTLLFWEVALVMESALNLFYLVMAFYGFWQWKYGGGDHHGVSLCQWSGRTHMVLLAVTTLVAMTLGWLTSTYTHADFAYLDALTTCFAVVGTFMLARKVVENWIYWVVIDLVSIYLYLNKGLWLTSALFVLYVVLAAVAYLQWRRQYQQDRYPDGVAASA